VLRVSKTSHGFPFCGQLESTPSSGKPPSNGSLSLAVGVSNPVRLPHPARASGRATKKNSENEEEAALVPAQMHFPPLHVNPLVVQFAQRPPVEPHMPLAVPTWHAVKQAVPQMVAQQPPLQGVSPAAPHAVVHVCVVVSQE